MKITAIDIIGYGKWIDAHFHDLQAMQLFYGANEAGKSTIMAFIHSILFGFPTRQQSTPRMEPKTGGAYGGRLTLTDTALGTVTIERLKGKATGDVTLYLEDGSIHGEAKWNELLGEMDRATYEAIFSFDIHALQNIQQWKQADFERYLLATSMTGSDLLLKAIEKLQKELDKRFKPSGRNPLINKQLETVKAANSRFEEAKAHNTNYETLYKEKEELEEAQQINLNRQKTLRLEHEQKQDWLDYWESYQEWANLAKYLVDKERVAFPTDGIVRLEHLNSRLTENKNKHIQLQERYQQLKKQTEKMDYSFFANKQDEITAITETYPLYQENLQRLTALQKELADIDHLLEEQAFEVDQELLLRNWQPIYMQQIEEEELALQSNQQRLEQIAYFMEEEAHKQNQLQQQIDHLEAEMWSRQQFQAAEEQQQKRQPSRAVKPNRNRLFLPLLAVGITGILAIFLPSKWMLALFGLAVLLAAGGLLNKRQPISQAFDQSELAELMEQRHKRQTWQEVLTQLDASQAKTEMWREECQQRFAENEQRRERIHATLQTLGIAAEAVNQKYYPFFIKLETSVRQIKQKQQLQSDSQAIHEEIQTWRERCVALKPPFQTTTFEELVTLLKQGMREYQNAIASVTKQEDKLEQVEAELELIRRDAASLQAEKEALLEKAGVVEDEAFRKRHQEAEEIEKNKARKHFLEMQSDQNVREALQAYASKETLKAELLEIEAELAQISHAQEKSHAEYARVNHEIQSLEAGGTFAALMQEFYTEKSLLQSQVKEWMTIRLSLEILKRTLERLQADKLPKALELASRYFKKLTKGHYVHVRFANNRLQVETSDQLFFFPEELSQATKEQLYLAVRFAFIDILHSKYPLPIIIDDSFVNFDKERLAEMMDLLKMRQGKNQVLMFSCHETSSDYFSSMERVVLY